MNNKTSNIVIAVLLIAVVIFAALYFIGRDTPASKDLPNPTTTSMSNLESQVATAVVEATLRAQLTMLAPKVESTEVPSVNNTLPAQVPTFTPSPTATVVNRVAQVVDLRGDKGPYNCLAGKDCLTDPEGWLKGRHALRVVLFPLGKSLDFLTLGYWSFHLESDVNQFGTLGFYDVQAFGTIADIVSGSPLINAIPSGNGAAIEWESAQYRANACIEWNKIQAGLHPDWNIQSQYCR